MIDYSPLCINILQFLGAAGDGLGRTARVREAGRHGLKQALNVPLISLKEGHFARGDLGWPWPLPRGRGSVMIVLGDSLAISSQPSAFSQVRSRRRFGARHSHAGGMEEAFRTAHIRASPAGLAGSNPKRYQNYWYINAPFCAWLIPPFFRFVRYFQA